MSSKKAKAKSNAADLESWASEQKTQEVPQDVRLLLRENEALKRKLLHGQGIEDAIIEAVKEVYSRPQQLILPPAIKQKAQRSKPQEEIAMLHISDTQIGKRTESYDHVVAAERLMLLAKKTGEITTLRRAAAKIDEVVVILGGDMVEAENNFPSQPHHISIPLIDQATLQGPEMIECALLYLLNFFEKMRVVCVVGNHGRNGPHGQQGVHEKTNWDRVLYRSLALRMLGSDKNPHNDIRKRVTFEIPDSFWAVAKIYDWGVLAVHGDQIRGGFAGFPWYGACVPEDHEILTRVGWKRYTDLKVGEEVLSFDTATSTSKWEPVSDINVYDFDGNLLSLSRPGGYQIQFTSNHKWPVVTREDTASCSLLRADQLNTTHWLPVHGGIGDVESIMSPRLASILGWIVTDGTARWIGNHWEAGVYQSSKKYLSEVESLLGTTGRPDKRPGVDCHYVAVSIEDRKEIAKFYREKNDLPALVTRLSRPAAEAMLDAMLKAEGSSLDSRQTFRQMQGPVAEAYQILSVMVGKTAWSTTDETGYSTLQIRHNDFIRPTWGPGLTETPYVGKIWCPTTPSGTWWVRNKGMVLPTGNSKKIWGWIDAIPEPFDYVAFGHFHTYASAVLNHRTFLANGCFPAGSLVSTVDGPVPIEEVEIGTKVINRFGAIETVEKRFKKRSDDGLIHLGIVGLPKELIATPNHEIWAIKGVNHGCAYLRHNLQTTAKYPTPNARAIPEEERGTDSPQWIPADLISAGDWVAVPSLPTDSSYEISDDLAWVYGLFAAEGSATVAGGAKKSVHRINFTMHINELPVLEKAKTILDSHLNLVGHIITRPTKTTSELVYNNKSTAARFADMFSRKAWNKRVPECMFHAPISAQKAFVDGWIQGDGHKNKKTGVTSGATTSRVLAWGIWQLATNIGYDPYMSQIKYAGQKFSNDRVVKRDAFSVTIDTAGQNSKLIDGQRFLRVSHRRRSNKVTDVFDLQVSGDHSYVVNMVGVHNSTESDNEYAQEQLAACGHPCQRLAFFNAHHGLIADHQVFLNNDRIPQRLRALRWSK